MKTYILVEKKESSGMFLVGTAPDIVRHMTGDIFIGTSDYHHALRFATAEGAKKFKRAFGLKHDVYESESPDGGVSYPVALEKVQKGETLKNAEEWEVGFTLDDGRYGYHSLCKANPFIASIPNHPDLAIVGQYVSRELIVFEGFGDAQMFAIKNGLNLTPTHVGWREVMYVCANESLKSVYCPLEGRKV